MFLDRVKPLDAILATAEKKSLHRSLGALQLTLFGIGCIIGTGIFVLTAAGAQKAGPGLMLAFVIAGAVCIVAALCYAEIAAMAQTVQLLGTIVHEPRLIVLDEPFSGLDAINQQKLEQLIRAQAAAGVTVVFSTHVIAHAERLCERVAIIAKGKVAFDGRVDEARARLRPIVRLRTRERDGPWRSAIPKDARTEGDTLIFELPGSGPEPLLKALIDGGAGIESLAIERPGLHEAFVAIAGEAAAAAMGEEKPQ